MPDSAVITQTNAFRAALLRNEAAQMRAMARRWATVERALQDGIADTLRQIDDLRFGGRQFGRNPDPYLQLDRYRALLAQTRRELARYAEYAETEIRQGIEDNARAGVSQSTTQIEIMADGDPAVLGNFNRMSVPAVENMTALLQERAPVGRLLREAFPDAAVRMTDALITGTALGWNPRKTAAAMVEGLQAGALQRALVIARTEQLRALRTAQVEGYRQSNVVTQWMRIASKSARTCLACLVADGTIYELESEFDEHPQGRCMCVPVLKGREPPTFTRGRAWLEAQPATVQRQIMGTGAYNAWQDGAVSLDDLVTRHEHPVWGPSLGTRALRDVLGAKVAAAYSGSAFYTQDNAPAVRAGAAQGSKFEPSAITQRVVNGKLQDSTFTIGRIGSTEVVYRDMDFTNDPSSAQRIAEQMDRLVAPAFNAIPEAHRSQIGLVMVEDFRGIDFGTAPASAAGNAVFLTAVRGDLLVGRYGDVVHEMGHVVHNTLLDGDGARRWLSATGWDGDTGNPLDVMRRATAEHYKPYEYRGPNEYGTFHPVEAWAESYRYLYAPDSLMDGYIEYGDVKNELVALMREILRR